MKKNTLIYITYVIIIISLTILISFKLIYGKMNQLPLVGKFIINEEIMNDSTSEFIEVLKQYASMPKEKRNNDLNSSTFLNSEGFKDYNYSIEKPNNTFRIVALGDSFTEGAFLETNDTWPKQLEKKLNELNTSMRFEVLNFGRSGAGTLEEVKIFEEKALKYNPDMVILLYYGNDYYDSIWIQNRGKELFESYKNGTIKLPEEIENISKEIGITPYEIPSNYFWFLAVREFINKTEKIGAPEIWKENVEKPLLNLISLCEVRNASLIVIGLDLGIVLNDNNLRQSELLKTLLDENKIQFLDFSGDFPRDSQTLRLPDDHLTELGYDILSDKIIKIILPYLG